LKVGISNYWGHHWSYINSVGYESVKHLAEISKFEEMFAEPNNFACKISDDIDLPHVEYPAELTS
jgi:hypothetical protein